MPQTLTGIFWRCQIPLQCHARTALHRAALRLLGASLDLSEQFSTTSSAHKREKDRHDKAQHNSAIKALQSGVSVRLVEFELSPSEAAQKFERYQRKACRGLHASGLLNAALCWTHSNTKSAALGPSSTLPHGGDECTEPELVPVFIPFWCFNATISVEVKGLVGFSHGSSKEVVWKEMEDWQRTVSHEQQGAHLPHMQVCASYRFAPQLAEGAKLATPMEPPEGPSTVLGSRKVTLAEAYSLSAAAGAASGPAPAACVLRSASNSAGNTPSSFNSTTPGVGSRGGGSGSGSSSASKPNDASGKGSGTTPYGRRARAASRRGAAPLLAPDMRQSIAWQLAMRALLHQQLAAAEPLVRAATGALEVRDLQVDMQEPMKYFAVLSCSHVVLTGWGKESPEMWFTITCQATGRSCKEGAVPRWLTQGLRVHERQVMLMYLPAYVARYQYGTRYKAGTSGVILPQWFDAIIGGTSAGSLVAPLHWSAAKMQLLAGGLVAGAALVLTQLISPLVGLGPVTWVGGFEVSTLAFLAATVVGSWARHRPLADRNRHVQRQAHLDAVFFRRYDEREEAAAIASEARAAAAAKNGAGGTAASHHGQGAPEKVDEHLLWLWSDSEWRGWENEEPWRWQEDERRAWAQQLWRKQMQRHLDAHHHVEKRRMDRLRQAHEEAADARRTRDYGPRSGHRPGRNAAPHAHGGRRRDFLGYYKVMGIDLEADVTVDIIKSAFKAAALQSHPDRVAHAEPDKQRAAHARFQKLQTAYDVLKDPEKRRAYDRGQLAE